MTSVLLEKTSYDSSQRPSTSTGIYHNDYFPNQDYKSNSHPNDNSPNSQNTQNSQIYSHKSPEFNDDEEFNFADDTRSGRSSTFHGSPVKTSESANSNENSQAEQPKSASNPPTMRRPRSNTGTSLGSKSNSNGGHKKRASYCTFESGNAYDTSSLSSCGSNQSRNSDYSFLGGKDEFVVEKESRTVVLATTSRSLTPPDDVRNNVQGYERSEGKTVVKTVKKLSVKKISQPPSSLTSPHISKQISP